MKQLFLSLLFFAAIFCEATFFQIPLVLIVIILLGIFQKKEWVLLVGGASGIVLDMVLFGTIGLRSLFFLGTLGLLFLYGKKFETQHILFSVIFVGLASSCYMLLFVYQHFFISLVSTLCITSIGFFLLTFLEHKKPMLY